MSFAWARQYEPRTDLGRWLEARMPLPRFVYNVTGGGYPVPRNLLFFLPWLDKSPVRSGAYRPVFRVFFWILVAGVLLLGLCGMKPAEQPWVALSQAAAAYYFAHFLIILPLISKFETPLPLPNSISQNVLSPDREPATAG